MDKYFMFFIFFMVTLTTPIFSQNLLDGEVYLEKDTIIKEKKNSFIFSGSLSYSRSDFQNYREQSNSWFKRLYDSSKPTRGLLGYSVGMIYEREILKKIRFSLGVRFMVQGQRSPRFFSIFGTPDEELESREEYGGTIYKITYNSLDIPVYLKYELYKKNRLIFLINFGASLNIYQKVRTKNYIVNKKNGKVEPGCCERLFFMAQGNLFEKSQKHLSEGLWRNGFFVGGELEYSFFPWLKLFLNLEGRYYTKLKDTSVASTVLQGTIFDIGLNFGTKFNF